MDERLLTLYETELKHLRETAAEFGRDFPKIAGRLSLDLDAKGDISAITVEHASVQAFRSSLTSRSSRTGRIC